MSPGVAPGSTWCAVLREGPGAPVYLGGVSVEDAAAWAARAGEEQVARCIGRAQAESLGRLRVEKKRRERLAGRIAARAALAGLFPGCAWEELPEVEARVDGPRAGAPVVVGHAATVSISHAGDCALAAVGGRALGVDVDEVAERTPDFADMALTVAERERLDVVARCWGLPLPAALTLSWCAKEAVLKALGTGLRAPLQEVEVLFPDERPVVPRGEVEGAGVPPLVHGSRRTRVWVRCGPQWAAEAAVERETKLWLWAGCERGYVYALVSP